jgi:hypothetical protein
MAKGKSEAKADKSAAKAGAAAKNEAPHPSVAEVLGGLTKERIAGVTTARTKKALTSAYALAFGIADAHVGKLNASTPGVSKTLLGNGLTLKVAEEIVAESLGTIAAHDAQVAKKAAYTAAVADTKSETSALGKDVAKKVQLLRGSIGGQSTLLSGFGVKPLGGARRKKKAATPPKTTTSKS